MTTEERSNTTPSIANICSSRGDRALDEWLEFQEQKGVTHMAEQLTTQDDRFKQQLEDLGIQVNIDYRPLPVYTLRYSFIKVSSPSADRALLRFVAELLKLVPVERA